MKNLNLFVGGYFEECEKQSICTRQIQDQYGCFRDVYEFRE